jgi:hypothetical protein
MGGFANGPIDANSFSATAIAEIDHAVSLSRKSQERVAAERTQWRLSRSQTKLMDKLAQEKLLGAQLALNDALTNQSVNHPEHRGGGQTAGRGELLDAHAPLALARHQAYQQERSLDALGAAARPPFLGALIWCGRHHTTLAWASQSRQRISTDWHGPGARRRSL